MPAIVSVTMAFGAISCGQASNQSPTREQLQSMMAKELPLGSSGEAVEAFFLKHKITYDYDDFANKYDGIIRYDKFDGIQILIWMNQKHVTRRIDLQYYTTAP
jgi:hypothetical protein